MRLIKTDASKTHRTRLSTGKQYPSTSPKPITEVIMNAKKRCKLRRIERRKLEREKSAAESKLEKRIESIINGF